MMAPLRLVLLVLFLFGAITSSAAVYLIHSCDGDANYTRNSTFQSNLNRLLASLDADPLATGFLKKTVGDLPDRVHGVVLCRGDVVANSCRSCVDAAVQDIVQQCPYKKDATIWYDDCMVRYSNLLVTSATGGSNRILFNTQNLTEVNQFHIQLGKMMTALVLYAAYNTTAEMFATGEAAYGESETGKIYGLVQCTRDISAADCDSCLRNAIESIRINYAWRRGARYLGDTCNTRYELYSFYNGPAMVSVPLSENATPPFATPPFAALNPPLAGSAFPVKMEGGKMSKGTVLAIALPLVAALILSCVICVYCCRRKAGKRKPNEMDSQEAETLESLLFRLSTLRAATEDFSELHKLGEGGFGSVYRGVLPDGMEVAVKRLSSYSGQGIEELKNEVVLLANLQHRNLVRLLGICLEEGEKLLVYEYVANRSLDTILFDDSRSKDLDWARRFKIIEGVARGLQYLHEDSQVKIVHRDLKANNILLDADMNPKISDFGLARLFSVDQTQASTTRVVGTYGYMAPEYAMRGNFSSKSDVFSFGVLVLEIITGQRNSSFSDSGASGGDLLSWVWERWTEGTVMEIVDPALGGRYQKSEVMRCIQLGLLCLQQDPASRPSMPSIVLRLSSFSVSLQVPQRPAFLTGCGRSGSYKLKEMRALTKPEGSPSHGVGMQSPSEVSMSEVEPR